MTIDARVASLAPGNARMKLDASHCYHFHVLTAWGTPPLEGASELPRAITKAAIRRASKHRFA